ncbi:Alternative cytochrome c oxidase subunit 1 [bacterium HR17]|uniref:Alternative cytochrome c oxidase subunit 1 n=1 Tax=Candidatus Fervidibacter japonicus TaxID=2035412 RepID=A0A2H5XB83_9BACT|nr:Alternative cytochrome c oxidase subunit 1 [bacterium HR17]
MAHEHTVVTELPLWRRLLRFSTDHKDIGLQYFFTAWAMAIIGGFLAFIIRWQLGFPTQVKPAPWLSWLFPHGAEGGVLKPEFYYALVTMHGTIMVFFFQTAILSGGFGNFLIPLQIGARDMAFPFLNGLSYWVFWAACIVLLLGFAVEGGAAAGGWTAYPPLSALKEAMPGSGWGMTLWLLAMALFIVSSTMGSLNYITTVLNLRTKGMTMFRLPFTTWTLFLAAILGLLTFPVLTAGALMLLLDRHLGTSFFVPTVHIAGKLIERGNGNPILWQHLFWFLGHPEVYILVLPALGFVGDIVATFARKPFYAYRLAVLGLIGIAFLSCLVWAHHQFVSGMNPYLAFPFSLLTILVSVPFATVLLCIAGTLWGGNIRFTTPMLFAIGFLSLVVTGGFGGLSLGVAANDLHLHDTYYVVGHFHVIMGSSVLFAIYAATYFWFPKMFGRMMNERLGKWHFWLSLFGVYGVFLPMHYLGLSGMMRRIYTLLEYDFLKHLQPINTFISVAAFVLIAAQALFVVNFFWSLKRGEQASANPWGATTLEWQTSSPPPHGNWGTELPAVYRWAYDYSPPDSPTDFRPQTEPLPASQ